MEAVFLRLELDPLNVLGWALGAEARVAPVSKLLPKDKNPERKFSH